MRKNVIRRPDPTSLDPKLQELLLAVPALVILETLQVGGSHSGNSRAIYETWNGIQFMCEEHFPYSIFKEPSFSYHADVSYTLEEAKALQEKHGENKVSFDEAWYGEDGEYMVFFTELEDLVIHLFETRRFDFQKEERRQKERPLPASPTSATVSTGKNA